MQPPKDLAHRCAADDRNLRGMEQPPRCPTHHPVSRKADDGSGLTIAQFGLMTQIAAASDDALGTLAERLGLDQSSLSRNLHALEREGLVEIAVVEHDLRRRAVWLTENGARRLEAAMPVWRSAHAALAEVLDPGIAQRLANASQALV
jgi:DNA-binding MarR family transcriptional regulator